MNPARSASAAAVVLAAAGALLGGTTATASATTTCASPVFKRQFFANTTFKGSPKKTDCDSAVGESWSGAPASGLPKDNFGVRWSVTRDFGSGGPFALAASGLDGIRVYVDGVRKVDLWKNTTKTVSKTVNLTLPQGTHTLRVDYVNWTGAAQVKFTYTPRTSATVDKVTPLTPTGTSVSYDAATGKARLTWSKNKEMDLAGYGVYRRLKGTPFGSTPLATTSSTSYTDTALPVTGETYYYEVRAYDKAGNSSAGTADLAVPTADRTAPPTPTGVSASSEPEGLRVGWSTVDGAASYRVYQAVSADGPYSRIGSTTGLSYLDTSALEGGVYYYRVTSLDAAGNESALSAVARAQRFDETPPPAVTGVTVTPTEYGFQVSWDADPAPDLQLYRVRRGEILGDPGEQVCSLYAGFAVSHDTTSYAYTVLPDGDESCFIVDAVDHAGNSSFEWTREAQVVRATALDMTPSVATPDSSPVRLTADPDGADVDLSWNSVTDATGYQVYRWNRSTGAYEKLAATTTTTFVDTAAAKGTTHFYWVTARYADGTESAPGGDYAVLAP